MATLSSTLAWRIPWTEEPVGYSLQGHTESDTTERLSGHTHSTLGIILMASPPAFGSTF